MSVAKELFYDWGGANVSLFHKINAISSSEDYDRVMEWVSYFAQNRLFPYYCYVLLGYIFLSMMVRVIRKKPGLKHYGARWVGVLAVFAAGFVVNIGVNHELKDYFGYPRPYAVLEESSVHLVEQRPVEDARRSFPSGHVAFASLLIFALWPMLSTNFRCFGVWLILLVGWSRIALGVHFPADVVWSMIISFFVVAALRMLIYPILHTFRIQC